MHVDLTVACSAARRYSDSQRKAPEMPNNPIPAHLSHAVGVSRCVHAIIETQASVSATDANELAEALWDRPSCRSIGPESSASKLFERNRHS